MNQIISSADSGLFTLPLPDIHHISPYTLETQAIVDQHRSLPEGTRIWKKGLKKIGTARLYANRLPLDAKVNLVLIDLKKIELPKTPSQSESPNYWQGHIAAGISRRIALMRDAAGNWSAASKFISTEVLYMYEVIFPKGDTYYYSDPMSTYQPFGAYGPSQVTDISQFNWKSNGAFKRNASEMVILEIHMATFSLDGTYKGLMTRKGKSWIKTHIIDRGFNAVSIMPLVQCPGNYNWGYDGSHPFAAHHKLGTLEELCELIRYLHSKKISVILDVQLNHMALQHNPNRGINDRMAPWDVGPAQHIPMPDGKTVVEHWGGPHWDHSARDAHFNVDPARYWIALQNHALFSELFFYLTHTFQLDGIRVDMSAYMGLGDAGAFNVYDAASKEVNFPILKRLVASVKAANPDAIIVAEDGREGRAWQCVADATGIDFAWNFEFMHVLHQLFNVRQSYDRILTISDLWNVLKYGILYPEKTDDNSYSAWVGYFSSHDEVGNHGGTRLEPLFDTAQDLRLAITLLFVARCIPMHFQGACRPFPFFRDAARHDSNGISTPDPRIYNDRGHAYSNYDELASDVADQVQRLYRMNASSNMDDDLHADLWQILSQYRAQHCALQSLDSRQMVRLAEHRDNQLLVIYRGDIIIGINLSEQDYSHGYVMHAMHPLPSGRFQPLFCSKNKKGIVKGIESMVISPYTDTFTMKIPEKSIVFWKK